MARRVSYHLKVFILFIQGLFLGLSVLTVVKFIANATSVLFMIAAKALKTVFDQTLENKGQGLCNKGTSTEGKEPKNDLINFRLSNHIKSKHFGFGN